MKGWALLMLAAAVAALGFWASRETRTPHAIPLGATLGELPVGAEVRVKGSVASKFDGTRFDAVARADLRPDGSTDTRVPGYFDLRHHSVSSSPTFEKPIGHLLPPVIDPLEPARVLGSTRTPTRQCHGVS